MSTSESPNHPSGQLPDGELPGWQFLSEQQQHGLRQLLEARGAEATLAAAAFVYAMGGLLERPGALQERIGRLSLSQRVTVVEHLYALEKIFSYTPEEVLSTTTPTTPLPQNRVSKAAEQKAPSPPLSGVASIASPQANGSHFALEEVRLTAATADEEVLQSENAASNSELLPASQADSPEEEMAELAQRQRRFLHQIYADIDAEKRIEDLTDQHVVWLLKELIKLYDQHSSDQESYHYIQWIDLWLEGMSDDTIAQLYNGQPSIMFQVRRKFSNHLRQSCSHALERVLHQVQATPVAEIPNETKHATQPAQDRAPQRSRESSIRTPRELAESIYQDSELKGWLETASNQQVGRLVESLIDTYLKLPRQRGRPLTTEQITRVKDWAWGTSPAQLAARDNLTPASVVSGRRVVAQKLQALDKELRDEVLQAIMVEKEENREPGLPTQQGNAEATQSSHPPDLLTPAQENKDQVQRSRLESAAHELSHYLGLSETQESALLERLQPGMLAVDLKAPPRTHEEMIDTLRQAWTSSFGTFAARSRLSPLQIEIIQRFLGARRAGEVPLTRHSIEYMIRHKLTATTDLDDEFANIFIAMLPREDNGRSS